MEYNKEENIEKMLMEAFTDLDVRLTDLEESKKPLLQEEIIGLIKKHSEEHKKSLIAELRRIVNEY